MHINIHNKALSAWLDILLYTEYAINNTFSQSTGYSPLFILRGQKVPLPFDHALAHPSKCKIQLQNHAQYMD